MSPDCIGKGFGPVGTNAPTEPFDAVLAEVEEIAQFAAIHHPEADDALHDRIMQAKARLAAAHAAEKEAAERDARRYRWLRLRLAGRDHVEAAFNSEYNAGEKLACEVDTAIDACMGEKDYA